MTIRIGEPAPAFTVQAYRRCEEEPVTVTLEDFPGDWLLVFFYPADFTFVCPTELQALAALEEQFHAAGASILAASTDSWFSHRAWFETDSRLAGVRYPIVADRSQKFSTRFGVLQDDGTALRGSFLIDPGRMVRHASVTDSSVGRAAAELLRLLHALQTAELCPVDWQPGEATLGIAA
jgi:peroxiredoxin (alkyl hydroperoxide reductase subunit C)